MSTTARKSSGRPSYYYRLLGRTRLQRQRSRSRSRSRPPNRESPPERPGRRRSMPGSAGDKTPTMEPSASTPFRVTNLGQHLLHTSYKDKIW